MIRGNESKIIKRTMEIKLNMKSVMLKKKKCKLGNYFITKIINTSLKQT